MESLTAADVLSFWFARSLDDPDAALARRPVWFAPDAAFDAQIADRFGATIEAAARGELDGWSEDARGALALVLLLDQFPRNAFRGTARAFAFDAMALRIARDALAQGYDSQLHPLEAAFLFLPFEHAEDLDCQDEAVRRFEALVTATPPAFRESSEIALAFAHQHREAIRRFGRFPHRNAVLGRASTPDELAHLESGGATFGAASADDAERA